MAGKKHYFGRGLGGALIPMLRLCQKVICDGMRGGDPMLRIVPCFGILEEVAYLGVSFGLVYRKKVFFSIVGSLIGIYLNTTAAQAEIEEVSANHGGSINSLLTNPSGLSMDLLSDDYYNISDKDVDKFHLDENVIPETVWTLHSTSQVNLNRIRDGVETRIDIGTGAHYDNQSSWIRSSFAPWLWDSMYTSGDLLSVPPLHFQAASCGGGQAERRDLDYCSIRDGVLRKEIEQQNSSDDYGSNATLATDDDVVSTKDASSSSNANDQSAPLLSTPTPFNNPPPRGSVITLDPCGLPSEVCGIVEVGLAAIVDTPPQPIYVLAPPIDVLPQPTPVTVFDGQGPGSGLPPLLTSQPVKPIPEASTWVMIITGFGILALAFRKKQRSRINPISIIDVP
jgi:hypothetical protein